MKNGVTNQVTNKFLFFFFHNNTTCEYTTEWLTKRLKQNIIHVTLKGNDEKVNRNGSVITFIVLKRLSGWGVGELFSACHLFKFSYKLDFSICNSAVRVFSPLHS